MKITVRRFGVTPQQLEQDIDFKFIAVKKGLELLGKTTQSHMQTTIDANRKRGEGSHRLEKNIKVYVEDEGKKNRTVGVGKIAELNIYAPYWRILNYGGLSGAAKSGRKVPGYFGNYQPPMSAYKGTGKGTEEFHYRPYEESADRNVVFFMKPESPIAAINYIQKAANYISTIWKVHFYNWTRSTKIHTR